MSHKPTKCEHGKVKTTCKLCGGGAICEHNKRRSDCKLCGGGNICEHEIIRYFCRQCNGAGLCEHGKRRSRCKLCNGGSFCDHGSLRYNCRECKSSAFCEHNKRRHMCVECHGTSICQHDKYKYKCPDCCGSNICKSSRDPYNTGCRTRGNIRLNGFCAHCFVNIFPNDPKSLTVRKKSKELQVVAHISNKYDGFIHDKPIYVDLEGGCCSTKRRIDLRKLINDTMLCIEVDEDQHKGYLRQDEQTRYDDLFMDFSGKYIFIRYNPDKFIDKYKVSKNPYFETRMEVLETVINKHIGRIEKYENNDLVEIHHVFYDEI